jgi:hypothetical protein
MNNPTFAALKNEMEHARATQAIKWQHVYTISDTVDGGETKPFTINIEQGTAFKCEWLTASAYSYDGSDATSYPIPNALGSTAWAGRGLSVAITDSNSGRELTSGYVPFELIATPGYGITFNNPYPFKYWFYPNSLIRFDVRNSDNSNRTHTFGLALLGFKYLASGE